MGERTTPGVASRRRKLLLGSALSLAVLYGLLLHFNPMGYGKTQSRPQYSPAAYETSSILSLTAREADSALVVLKDELEKLKEENSELRGKQTSLLEAIEKSLLGGKGGEDEEGAKGALAGGLRAFLQKQEQDLSEGVPTPVTSHGGHLRDQQKQEVKEEEEDGEGASEGGGAAPSTRLLLLRHRESGSYVEVDDFGWLHATGDALGPMARRAFELTEGPEGRVWLRSLGNDKFVRLVPPNQEPAWVFKADGTSPSDPSFVFKLVSGRFVFNPHASAYMNVIHGAQGALRGHGNDPRKGEAAGQEGSAEWELEWVSQEQVDASRRQEELAAKMEALNEDELIKKIHELPRSSEKRVISYGLYGDNPKYTLGAIRNAELVDTYFPGWVARFYVDDSVPSRVIDSLTSKGAEIVRVEGMRGSIAGMFWRFLVADDPEVDRYIVRDSDSRLNARDRFAVEEWIRSNKSVHSVRDHVNHCRPLNGGLWGGVKGGIKDMTGRVKAWSRKSSYGEDLSFLNQEVWPAIRDDQISHDAYCCEQYPNARPFPTKRPANYQHVGQVFDAQDQPRMDDINRFIRGKVIPPKCRRKPEWIYG